MTLITTVLTYTVFLPLMLMPLITADTQTVGTHWWDAPIQEYAFPHQWVRLDARWQTTQPEPWLYDWTFLDEAIGAVRDNGGFVLLNIRNTPAWAHAEYQCKLPPDIGLLANFVDALITRYHPDAIELWNEPEMTVAEAAANEWCCGCLSPAEYRAALQAVYPTTRGRTVLVAGSLVYNVAWVETWLSQPVTADAVSFHHYNDYPGLGVAVLTTHLNRMRQTGLPVWITETALLCPPGVYCALIPDFRQVQAAWVPVVYNAGADKVFWFTADNVGWRSCNLVNENTHTVYPAWHAVYDEMYGKHY